jgi:aryl-alcohol dehydrogenase-like predicted oxidoreductase
MRELAALVVRRWHYRIRGGRLMEYRNIGSLEVSVVGLGCNNFGRHLDQSRTGDVVGAALDSGVNFFDTADVYFGIEGASEVLLGTAIRGHRDEVVIATKFGKPHPQGDTPWGGASPAWVQTAVEASLRRLGTDHIDLYQLHEPDPQVPILETLGALGELITAGKVREIGHSTMTAGQMREARQTAPSSGLPLFVSTQLEWNLIDRRAEAELIPTASELHMSVLPFFPLSSGLLTGKYRLDRPPEPNWRLGKIHNRAKFIDDGRLTMALRLEEFAVSRGHTSLELAFSWLASFDCVASVIAGATRAQQVVANAAAASWRLTEEELRQVDVITESM